MLMVGIGKSLFQRRHFQNDCLAAILDFLVSRHLLYFGLEYQLQTSVAQYLCIWVGAYWFSTSFSKWLPGGHIDHTFTFLTFTPLNPALTLLAVLQVKPPVNCNLSTEAASDLRPNRLYQNICHQKSRASWNSNYRLRLFTSINVSDLGSWCVFSNGSLIFIHFP